MEAYRAKDRPKIDRLMAKAEIHPGAWALEPGCGAGRLTEIPADAVGPAGQVMACDINSRMIQACRRCAGSRGNIRVAHAAVEEYAIEPERCDVIVCHQVFPHSEEKMMALRTLVRRLKPCGRLLVVHFSRAEAINDRHRWADPILHRDLLPALGEMGRLVADAGLAVDRSAEDELGYLVRARRTEDGAN